jgi:hypothetical protein
MPEKNEQSGGSENFGKVFFSWSVPEFTDHQRSGLWYLIMSVIAVILIIFCIFTGNYFFALIVILAAFIVFLKKYNQPGEIMLQITEDGVMIGNQRFSYEDLNGFYIIYNPPVKKLYFKMKKMSPDDISVPLFDNNPIPIRAKLLEYLDEDLTKEHQSISDIFETLFRL